MRPDAASALLADALARLEHAPSRWLTPAETDALLGCYAIAVDRTGAAKAGPGELFVGVVHDKVFGPVIACGPGAPASTRRHDVEVRLTPLTDADAADLARRLDVADAGGFEAVLLRVSAMVEAHPEIVELDLHPVSVGPDGAVIADARIRIEAVTGAR